MLRSTTRLIAMLVMLALCASAATAQGAAQVNPRQQFVSSLRSQLQLTPTQVTQVNAILEAQDKLMQSRMASYQAQIRAVLTPQQLSMLQSVKTLDQATVAKLNLTSAQVARLKAIRDAQAPEVQAAQQDTTSKINAILTPSQRTRFAQLITPPSTQKGGTSH